MGIAVKFLVCAKPEVCALNSVRAETRIRCSARVQSGLSLKSMGLNQLGARRVCVVLLFFLLAAVSWTRYFLKGEALSGAVAAGSMAERTVGYFLKTGALKERSAADIRWAHAANSQHRITEALRDSTHMIEADVLLRGREPKEPIMAHPPDDDSDLTLQDWLKMVVNSDKGIKLDFKSQEAVVESMALLDKVRDQLKGPVWINADILPGPGGTNAPLDAQAFLQAVAMKAEGDVLSLGWTTGWSPNKNNPGYSWEMVQQMEAVCKDLTQPVTFPVRAALLPQSFVQFQWLLQQSDRYTLTIWTGKSDVLNVEDLLPYRQNFSKSRIYYDLLESQISKFKSLPGYTVLKLEQS